MSNRKLFLDPFFEGEDVKGDGGIRRVVEAQQKYLPGMGWELTRDPHTADVLAVHASLFPEHVTREQLVVSHCHGLYWAEYEWPHEWYYKMNVDVIHALVRADVTTAPSEWVARAMRQSMWLSPTVLTHGIEPDEFPEPSYGESLGYVLWNKTRMDPVCTSTAMNELARRAPDVQFVSTYGELGPNISLTGTVGYEQAREYVKQAGVYLATTRETFGIGTLEAMAFGVPILGWDWGGQAEFVEHKVTGWLSRPGDYDNLLEGLRFCLVNRTAMGRAAREHACAKHSWEQVIGRYSDLYAKHVKTPGRLSPRVSVIMTCYNLERYLPEAIRSVLQQRMQDWELIIVDDCSPHTDQASIQEVLTDLGVSDDERIKVLRNETNLYVTGAVNAGMAAARAEYVISLDADNMFGPQALGLLADSLDAHRELDIVYGTMEWFIEQPGGRIEPQGRSPWPPAVFSFDAHMKGQNQIPSTCMIRKKVWDRVGGYRERCRTAEDADTWARMISFGATPAKVTDATTLIYRTRHDSISNTTPIPNWPAWYPWGKDKDLLPPAAAVSDPIKHAARNVQTYEPCLVSVVVPVGPGHEKLVKDAVDSLVAQTFLKWEVIVVNDTGKDIPWIHSFVQVLQTKRPGSGPACARNLGCVAAKGRVVLFLDADDYLNPNALKRMYEAWLEVYAHQGKMGYVYTDYVEWSANYPEGKRHESMNYNPHTIFEQMQHSVTVMVDKAAWELAGGFDETTEAWEDWDFFITLASKGICGIRLPEPMLNYRFDAGTVREKMHAEHERLKALTYAKWKEYIDGGKQLMACGSCGGGPGFITVAAPPPPVSDLMAAARTQGDFILLEFTADKPTSTYVGPRTQQPYRFGADDGVRVQYVHKGDAEYLLRLEDFKVYEGRIADEAEPLSVAAA